MGIYIVFDYFYKIGKMFGSVNVVEYVKIMRENWMNMVEIFVSKLFIVNKFGVLFYFGKLFDM